MLSVQSDARLRQIILHPTMVHPAKMNLYQIADLLRVYSVPGGTLLDPFGGAGSIMMACAPIHGGMHVLTYEIADHFVALQHAAWNWYRSTIDMQDAYAIPPGTFTAHCGSSAQMSATIASASVDLIITSPPYGGAESVDNRKRQNDTNTRTGMGNSKRLNYQGTNQSLVRAARQLTFAGRDPDDINLALIAMGPQFERYIQRIWKACYTVLKPNALLIMITRDCVQKNTIVPLTASMQRGIMACGFQLEMIQHYHLNNIGFFHQIRQRRNADAVVVDRETISIFRKGAAT